MNSQTGSYGMQLIALTAGALLFVLLTAVSCRTACRHFERIDL